MVIGHALATQAVPALWARPMAVVEGLVFAPAEANELAVRPAASPAAVTVGTVASAASATAGTATRPATRPATGAATHPGHRVATARHTASQGTQVVSARQVGWARHTDTTTPSAAAHARKHAKHAKHAEHGNKHSEASLGNSWSHLPPGFRWR